MSEVVSWEAPPEQGRKVTDWKAVRAELQAHPNEWALVHESYPNNMPPGLRRASIEVRTVRISVKPHRFKIYARYVPETVKRLTSAQIKQHNIEDIEDLLRFGATFEEIIERSAYSSWASMLRALRWSEREDLIKELRKRMN